MTFGFQKSVYFSDEFTSLLLDFVSSMKNKRTAAEYWGSTRILCDFIKKDFLALEPSDVQLFFNYMTTRVQQGALKKGTVNIRLCNYRRITGFIMEKEPQYAYLADMFTNLLPYEMDIKISPSTIPSLSEIDSLLSVAKDNMMYHLIFCLCFRMALTASQVVSLKMSHIQKVDGRRYICYPATSDFEADRILMMPDDVNDLMDRYLDSMVYFDDEGHLFYNKYNNPLTIRNLDRAVHKYMKRAKVPAHYTLKDLRSRAVIDMLYAAEEGGVSSDVVADYVGVRGLRLRTYVSASTISQLKDSDPASLVSIRVNT